MAVRVPAPSAALASILPIKSVGTDRCVVSSNVRDGTRASAGIYWSKPLVAAARSVDRQCLPHSMHAVFVRPGTPGASTEVAVERICDGDAFALRQGT